MTGYRRTLGWSLALMALFAAVIATVSAHGRAGRIMAAGSATFRVDTPEQAYAIWAEKGVKGRVLILFDNYPHALGYNRYPGGSPVLTSRNLVEYAIFKNIVRRLYYVVREDTWDEFRRQDTLYHPLREVPGMTRGLYLFTFSGIPVIAVTPSSLPQIAEKSLVYLNTSLFDEARTRELLAAKQITSDILIVCRNGGRP